jgi:hypothetical protein
MDNEVYLYGCDVCCTVQYNIHFSGDRFCVYCNVCKELQFHKKIVLCPVYFGMNHFLRDGFFIEESKDGSTSEKEE